MIGTRWVTDLTSRNRFPLLPTRSPRMRIELGCDGRLRVTKDTTPPSTLPERNKRALPHLPNPLVWTEDLIVDTLYDKADASVHNDVSFSTHFFFPSLRALPSQSQATLGEHTRDLLLRPLIRPTRTIKHRRAPHGHPSVRATSQSRRGTHSMSLVEAGLFRMPAANHFHSSSSSPSTPDPCALP